MIKLRIELYLIYVLILGLMLPGVASNLNPDNINAPLSKNGPTEKKFKSEKIPIKSSSIIADVSVSIELMDPGTVLCEGMELDFEATSQNEGDNPSYQWQVNGVNTGTPQLFPFITLNNLKNGDVVKCILTSSLIGVGNNPAKSNEIKLNLKASPPTPIASNAGPYCVGETIQLKASFTGSGYTLLWSDITGSFTSPLQNPTRPGAVKNMAGLYIFTLTNTDGCNSSATTEVVVEENGAPKVTIESDPSTFPVCKGDPITFTVSVDNAGDKPTYQWKVNGINANSTLNVFTSNNLNDNDEVICEVVSNSRCANPKTAISVPIKVTLTTSLLPTVTITQEPAKICPGGFIIYTATSTNGGSAPIYRWQVNGVDVASGENYFADNLKENDKVVCVLTSSSNCASIKTVKSNEIIVKFLPAPPTPVVTNSGSYCVGETIQLNATIIGTGYSFEWYGPNVFFSGNQNPAIANATIVMSGEYVLSVRDTNGCTSSSSTIVQVNTQGAPGVTINSYPLNGIVCIGESIKFTPTSTNGGNTPTYQWKINGVNIATGATYTSSNLKNNDVVSCELTSNSKCASPLTATSNQIKMTVSSSILPTVTVTYEPDTNICVGTPLLFSASPVNGGNAPVYQWQVNGVNVGTGDSTYYSSIIKPTDVINCIMTSNSTCASVSKVKSIDVKVVFIAGPQKPTASNGGPYCEGETIALSGSNASANLAYFWQGPDNFFSDEQNPTIANAKSSNGGAYTLITYDLISGCQSEEAFTEVVIKPKQSPSINVTVNPSNTICSGTFATFTANSINQGTNPTYQWKVNGTNVGTSSSTFTSSTLKDLDVITCEITANQTCASNPKGISSPVTMSVTPVVTPTITISGNPGSTICAGSAITFTAQITNGGGKPTYQWQLNGSSIGNGASTFTSTTLSNGDVITCILTSDVACVSSKQVTSNAVKMTVNPIITPSITIKANPDGVICKGSSVTFTATAINGGTSQAFQWLLNGNIITGANLPTYTTSNLINGETISCKLTSNASCVTSNTVNSNNLVMSVKGNVTPTITVTTNSATTICEGTPVTFNATSTNGGNSPVYQWKIDGTSVGTNTNIYTLVNPTKDVVITCELTSSEVCAAPVKVTSSELKVTVNPKASPLVTVNVNPGNTICAGTMVTFTANVANGGTAPVYQWKINGTNVNGANTSVYSSSGLSSGQVVTCQVTSNATCANPAVVTSQAVTMTVSNIIAPTIKVTADPSGEICSGKSVTFKAIVTNGGSSPTYQWKLNGGNVGMNSNLYTSATLNNNDIVTCELTSNANCANPVKLTSSDFKAIVVSNITPSVVVVANPSGSICTGTSVTFTANALNGGSNPSYQWKLNGNTVGTNSSAYTTTTLANNDVVTCVVTSSETCANPNTVSSNNITISVTPSVTPSVSVAATPAGSVCPGATVTFQATAISGGSKPSFQWKLNGNNVGTDSVIFSTSNLKNNDAISCVINSSESCASTPTATSNIINMTVKPSVKPTISVTPTPSGSICAGVNVNFSANSTDAGASPVYQWQVNGVNAGTSASTYSSSALQNGDKISCTLTSTADCAEPATVRSDTVNMTVLNVVTPSITIISNPLNAMICEGSPVVFSSSVNNGGSNPTYQWKVNGNIVGNNSDTYTASTLKDNDVVSCELISNEACVSSTTALSNKIKITVVQKLEPSVTITANPNGVICSGTSVIFTAIATNEGQSPTYEWVVNGTTVGSNSNIYSAIVVANNDLVKCKMTSDQSCVTTKDVISNEIKVAVNDNVTPSITIAASPAGDICAGSPITFTANAINEGSLPVYQWQMNGVAINGATGATYTSSTLVNGSVISCALTSNAVCSTTSTAISNGIAVSIKTPVTPTVTISSTPSGAICKGTSVVFTADPVNGGSNPSYQWKLNDVVTGIAAATYESKVLKDGDSVICVLNSIETCVTISTAISNGIIIKIKPDVKPEILISANPSGAICKGVLAKFSSTIVNGGINPGYQWQVSGANISGAVSPSYASPNLTNGEVISCILTSSESCSNPTSVSSNSITAVVNPVPATPTITMNGNTLSSSAKVGNQWYLNGSPIKGATDQTYVATVNGVYTLVVTVNGCSSTNYINVTTIGINEKEVQDEVIFSVYPNPSEGEFTLDFSSQQNKAYSFYVLSMIGNMVLQEKMNVINGEYQHKISMTTFGKGAYILVVTDGVSKYYRKLIIN
jgi:hypothetical protein